MTGQICSVIACVPWQPLASFTRMETFTPRLFAVVGVPLMTPVLALSASPAGSVPLVTVQVL
jgi:hypothetical protein